MIVCINLVYAPITVYIGILDYNLTRKYMRKIMTEVLISANFVECKNCKHI